MSLLLLLLLSSLSSLSSLPYSTSTISPLSTKSPLDYGFKGVTRTSKDTIPSSILKSAKFPYHTNSWWTNSILGSGDTPYGNIENTIFQSPYNILINTNGLSINYPYIIDSGIDHVQDIIDSEYTFKFTFDNSKLPTIINDELTIQYNWGTLISVLVRGDPYITLSIVDKFNILLPTNIISYYIDNGAATLCKDHISITKTLKLLTSNDISWKLYFFKPIILTCGTASLRSDILYTGNVRFAVVNNCTTGINTQYCSNKIANSNDFELLLDSSNAIVTSSTISWGMDDNTATYCFDWNVAPFIHSVPTGRPILLAFPHHVDTFDANTLASLKSGGHRNIRGFNRAVLSLSWCFTENVIHTSFHAFHQIQPSYLNILTKTIHADAKFDLPPQYQVGATDPYNIGKLFAKMARIAIIAEQLGELFISESMVNKLSGYLDLWLFSKSENIFLFDQTWGSIYTCGCYLADLKCNNDKSENCPNLNNPMGDFGTAYFNDHHFHYGYFIYSAAVIAKINPSWLTVDRNERLLFLIRDVMNPSTNDPMFPTFRYKDWFSGNSWANGITLVDGMPFYQGRNQESISESVNFYYSVCLYALVLKDILPSPNLASFSSLANIMLSQELRAGITYWQITTASNIYPKIYSANKIVGILWSSQIQRSTWFGSNLYYVHGIQALPSTPINEILLRTDWIDEEFPIFKQSCNADCVNSGWAIILYLNQAVFDEKDSFANLSALPDSIFGYENPASNGHSRSNCYYWIATQPTIAGSRVTLRKSNASS